MIERLAFLRGNWAVDTFEVSFTAARAGTILGTMRDIAGDRTTYFEFFYIAEADGTLVLDPYAMGDRMARYEFARDPQPEHGAIFENAAVAFPSRLIFLREGAKIRLAVEGERDGEPVRMEWAFARAEE